MPNATLEFKLPEEQDEFESAIQAGALYCALWDVRQEIFRPARKHGYSDPSITDLLHKLGPDAVDLIHLLEDKFNELLEAHGITKEI